MQANPIQNTKASEVLPSTGPSNHAADRINAKMREKAASQLLKLHPPKLVHSAAQPTPQQISALNDPKNPHSSSVLQKQYAFTHLSSKHALPAQSTVAPVPRTPNVSALKERLLSPFDTYQVSDADDDSESDDESEHKAKSKKYIPNWAQPKFLDNACKNQFNFLEMKHSDPDNIFGKVDTCDLHAVFGKSKRFRNRQSTGNWTNDKLTEHEVTMYKVALGIP
jgi:hypothetical protein